MNSPVICPHCQTPATQVGAFWICPEHGQLPEPKPFTPLRLFLSYGHDANEELVRRIKDDLEKRGHDVWFDKDEIKFGDEWRRSITDGITHSDRFLSFLSRHSTRDPGVCLDEIRIAIGAKGGNIQSILVESEQEVQPPPSISHIQWLDMHDWQERRERGLDVPPEHPDSWETWYQEKLAEIIRVVESDESRKFAGEIRTLEEHLKPVVSDFAADARIQKLLEKKLTGRAWLFDAVEKWRTAADRSSRIFWMMGLPGFGKSFFAAHLAHFYGRGTVIGAHFCAYDKPDHRSAPRIIRTLAFQLATRLPDYRKLLLTLPEIAELDDKQTAAELFDYLLANPLKLSITGGRERLLIVIDALDEAGGDGRNELVEMLARHAPSLPDWIGLVVTSRPESDVRAPLQGLNPFVLDTATEANRADLREYLRHELAPQLQPRPDAGRLVEQILEKSEGVFLYAERFCDDVQRGHRSLDRPEQFPQGLGGIFLRYFQRQFPDLEKYRKVVRPALRAILAAREPLPVEILQHLFHWQDEELRDFTRPLGSLFPVSGETGRETIKPFHKSLADWLTDEAKTGEYFVSVIEGHRMLAELCWLAFNDAGYFEQSCDGQDKENKLEKFERVTPRLPEIEPPRTTPLPPYIIRNLLGHLLAVGRFEESLCVLCCEEFLNLRREIHDRFAIMAACRTELMQLPETYLSRFWNDAPEECVLMFLRGIGSVEDFAQADETQRLLAGSFQILMIRKNPKFCSLCHILAGRIALRGTNATGAQRHLSEGLRIAIEHGFSEGMAKARLSMGILWFRVLESLDQSEESLQNALRDDFAANNFDFRARTLLVLSMLSIKRGQAQKAAEYLTLASTAMASSSDPYLEAWLEKYRGYMHLLSRAFLDAEKSFDAAGRAFAPLITLESERCHALATQVKRFASGLSVPEDADESFKRIVNALVDETDPNPFSGAR